MPPRRVVSDPRVTGNVGRVALARGPLIYCVESHDRPELDQDAFALPDDAAVTTGPVDERLPGMTLLETTAVPLPGTPERGALYQPVPGDGQTARAAANQVPIRAIPYFAWANRGAQHHGCVAAAGGNAFGLRTTRRCRAGSGSLSPGLARVARPPLDYQIALEVTVVTL